MGAEDLIANGCDVAVVEHHVGSDPYVSPYSTARKNNYDTQMGIPRVYFDGIVVVLNGNHTISKYPEYLIAYNQCIAIDSDFTIDIYGENTSGNDYDMIVEVNNVNNNTTSGLVVHLCLTESGIVYSWQGLNNLEWVEHLMIPNENGTPLDFTSGNQ